MKTLILTTTAAVALMFAGADSAQAGQFRLVIGNGGINGGFAGGGFNNPAFGGIQNGHIGHPGHPGNPGLPPGPGCGHYDWHDTSHYDYIPGRWVRSGCGWRYVPGRYVFHQDGHWDFHGHP